MPGAKRRLSYSAVTQGIGAKKKRVNLLKEAFPTELKTSKKKGKTDSKKWKQEI